MNWSDTEGILCTAQSNYKSWFAWLSPRGGEGDQSLIPGLNPLRTIIMLLENFSPFIGWKYHSMCFIFFWLFFLGECLAKILVAPLKCRAPRSFTYFGIRKTLLLSKETCLCHVFLSYSDGGKANTWALCGFLPVWCLSFLALWLAELILEFLGALSYLISFLVLFSV